MKSLLYGIWYKKPQQSGGEWNDFKKMSQKERGKE